MGQGMGMGWVIRGSLTGFLLMLVAGCGGQQQEVVPRKINLYQTWSLQPGDPVGDYQVQSGLGDVAVALQGNQIYMPFDGQVQPDAEHPDRCVIVSSAEVPAYLFRLCGVQRPHLGELPQGTAIGHGQVVAFATLRKQSDGTWAMVEPAKELLAQFLSRP